MRRFIVAVGLSLSLLMSLTTVAAAGDGNAYGKRIKACTGLSYGQLKKAVLASEFELPEGHPSITEGLKPAWGAKKTWLHIKDGCSGEDAIAGFGKGMAYGRRIKECTGMTYGQLLNAARAGQLPGHDPELIEGIKPAWGAKRTWMHVLPYCQPEEPVEET